MLILAISSSLVDAGQKRQQKCRKNARTPRRDSRADTRQRSRRRAGAGDISTQVTDISRYKAATLLLMGQ